MYAAFSATARHDAREWLLLVTAAVDVILGILFMANPGSSALAIAQVLELVAIVWGIAFLVTGFIVRRDAHGAKQLLRSAEASA